MLFYNCSAMKWCQRLPFPSKEPSLFWCGLKGHLIFEFNIPHTLTFHLGDVKYANAFYFMYVYMSHNLWHNGGVMRTPCQPWSQSLLGFQLCLFHNLSIGHRRWPIFEIVHKALRGFFLCIWKHLPHTKDVFINWGDLPPFAYKPNPLPFK
jgi:hypothetical protein